MRVPSRAWIAIGLAVFAGLRICPRMNGMAAEQTPTTPGNATKFTNPPGRETDSITTLIDQVKAALKNGTSTSAILAEPAFLSLHEWPRFRSLIRDAAQSTPLTIVTTKEAGQPLIVTGRVVDDRGQPVKAALAYFYQTSDQGWYSDRAAHISTMEGDRKHARLFGYLKTTDAGRFELRTIRPAGYPDSNLPAHIHVEVEQTNSPTNRLITEIQFDDDPRLTAEWRQRSAKDGFVIATVRTDADKQQRVEVELKMR